MKERYHISGMTCSACSAHVEKSVAKIAGTQKASVNLLTETMDVEYDEKLIGEDDIIDAVVKAGYGASLQSGAGNGDNIRTGNAVKEKGREQLKKKAKEEDRSMKWRLGISIAFLIPLMYVAMYHMFQDWFGIPIPKVVMNAFHGNGNAINFAFTQFLLVLPILYVNRKFFSVGFKTLLRRSPNMDSLIALGASAAVGYGIFAMYRISYGLGHGNMVLVEQYSHDLYFESAGMILTLITVGKYLESRSKGKTSEAITKLMDLSPKTAIVLNADGEEVEIPTDQLQKGEVFLVKPGSFIPVDGIVLEGNSSIDEAVITGESVPVEKQVGDKVVSATMNKSGFLKCRAERVGEDTTLSQIIRLVEEASASKAPIAQLADKVSGVFVPVVIAIAMTTLLVWLVVGAGAEFAISAAIAVLVISCPCALGLATPVAIMVGTGVGASHGILIKSGEALQQAKEIDTVVLDKTGTITEGKLKVKKVHVFDKLIKKEQMLVLAAALEKQSEHPLAEAIVGAAEEILSKDVNFKNVSYPVVQQFKAVFGRGIQGVVSAQWMEQSGLEQGEYYIGNKAYIEEQNIEIDESAQKTIDALADDGQTPLLVAKQGTLLGVIGVADQLKESSREAIADWHKMNIRVIMLTGDNKRTAEAVRKQLGLEEVIAEVLPQDKEQKISQLKEQGRKVAMIGDGINDAPALVAADVGLAIGAGTDVAIESADIVLMKSDLRDAVTAMKLSRAVIRNIKQNLFWAFFYNALGIPLAAGVLYTTFNWKLSPMFGAAAMSLSSIFVVGNALRLRFFKTNNKQKNEPLLNEQPISEQERIEEKEMTKVIKIEGMSCGHCTGRVQKALEGMEGVASVVMSLEEKNATVTLNSEVSDDVLSAAVTEAGYEVINIVDK